MHTDPDPHAVNPEHLHHPEVSFEKRDLSASGILLFFAVLFISGVAIYLVIWGMYKAFNQIAALNESRPNPMAVAQPVPQSGVLQNTASINLNQFAGPRLQSDEPTDMQKLLWQENQVLEAQPWQGQDGVVHIPIEQAMQILAQRGLRTRPGSGQALPPRESAMDQGTPSAGEKPGDSPTP